MSTDLELRQELLEIRLPAITVNVSQSSEVTEDGTSSEGDCETPKIGKPSEKGTRDEKECQTPKSPKHMIPMILSCPPAPRKPRKVASCKRKLCELQFFDVVARDEVESFFRQFETNSKRRCIV